MVWGGSNTAAMIDSLEQREAIKENMSRGDKIWMTRFSVLS